MTVALLPRHFVEKPWGREDLPPDFGQSGRRVGEVWYDFPDASLPVLVKWLFTSERLSIQVHPDDEQARARGLSSGKEECWIVTAAEPGATLGIGTLKSLTSSELYDASLSGEIENLLDWKPVAAGDWFFIPAGTVHAIGAGVTLVEVQQNADITYRLYDYGRPRELHLEDGVAVSTAAPYGAKSGNLTSAPDGFPFVSGPDFQIYSIRSVDSLDGLPDGEALIVPLIGGLELEGLEVEVGSVVLVDTSSGHAITKLYGEALLVMLEPHDG